MNIQTTVLGGGCFWCTEAVFQNLQGVIKVRSGYSGGSADTASYKLVCSGMTRHAEVIEIEYDADQVSYAELLEVHFSTHDPTTLNQQGADKGPQYRSAIFYKNEEEKAIAQKVIDEVASKLYANPVVTTLEPFEAFYEAEAYHQEYYNKVGGRNPYCSIVIEPKVAKFRAKYADRLKS